MSSFKFYSSLSFVYSTFVLATVLPATARTAPMSQMAPVGPMGAMPSSPMNGSEFSKNFRTVLITYQDITPQQPFSPAIFVTHSARTHVFKPGEKASAMLGPIAEFGNIGPLAVAAAKGLGDEFGSAAAAVHTLPGQTRQVQIAVDEAHPLLSAAWMLGQTNDGFSGIDSVDVWSLTAPLTIEVRGYDAGTQINSEKKDFTPALGGQMRNPENGVVTYHTGIRGDADAPKTWNWDVSKPVAHIVITPVSVKPL